VYQEQLNDGSNCVIELWLSQDPRPSPVSRGWLVRERGGTACSSSTRQTVGEASGMTLLRLRFTG
jgi:hypothetical protein